MGRHVRDLMVAGLVLVAAGAAAANGLLTPGPSSVTATAGPMVAQASSSSTTTVNPTTGGVGTTTSGASSTGTRQGAGATTTTTPITSTAAASASSGTTVAQIVSLTRTVEAGATAFNAFTVPAGRTLVVTDVLITNTGASPVCGASIGPSGATSTTTTGATVVTPGAAVMASPIEAGTGQLCVPAQTSLNLGLTTGLEFTSGQSVLLGNAPATASPTNAPLHFHLRGFLVTTSV
jgi:hypothetical protein